MIVRTVLAEMAVKDLTTALAWYERLFDRPADTRPMDGLAEWYLVVGGGLQVFQDKVRAGYSWVTLSITSLDDQLAALKARGIPFAEPTRTEYIKTTTVTDPDGNHLTFAQLVQQ